LNTGQTVRSYAGHTGQISSLSWRPAEINVEISRTKTPVVTPVPEPTRRRSSVASDNSLESLFGDGGESVHTNGLLTEDVIDSAGAHEQEKIPPPQEEKKEVCKEVFLCSSIDGAITLWDRRQNHKIEKLGRSPRGTPPWCMSVTVLVKCR
jgi:transcriptional activator SPT8